MDLRLLGTLALAAGLTSCSTGGSSLFVHVTSDLAVDQEVLVARVELFDGQPESGSQAPARRRDHVPLADLERTRIAVYEGLEDGDRWIRVRLLDARGRVVLERLGLVAVRGSTFVTMAMTRDCRDVDCPLEDGDSRVACLSADCVDPRCTAETAEFCPPAACAVNEDCAAGTAACSEGACVDGVCLLRGVDARCDGGAWCHPEQGCIAGAPDAGPPDGGPPDAGPPDLGPNVTCGDGVRNGAEVGVDCGGPVCPACPAPAPLADISGATELEPDEPLVLTLREEGSREVASWTIDWGDGTVETLTEDPDTATHAYPRGGVFAVLVAMTDAEGTHLLNDLLVMTNDQEVFRYRPTGELVRTYGSGEFEGPGFALPSPGGEVLVTGYFSETVERYDLESGTYRGALIDPREVWGPTGAAFGPDGRLYVSAFDLSEVRRFDRGTGQLVDAFATDPALQSPTGLVFSAEGDLFVAGLDSDAVFRFDEETGQSQGAFAVDAEENGPASPEQLAFGPDGDLFVSSGATGRVLRYDHDDGLLLGDLAELPAGRGASGLAFAPDGTLFVSSATTDEVVRFDSATGELRGVVVRGAASGLRSPHFLSLVPSHIVTVLDDADGNGD